MPFVKLASHPDFDYALMCMGSERRGIVTTAGHVKCTDCLSWVPAFPATQLVPVHENPYDEKASAQQLRNAWSVIMWEYNLARKAGRLIRPRDNEPGGTRFHVTALQMVRPS